MIGLTLHGAVFKTRFSVRNLVDTEAYIAIAVILIGVLLWGLKKYQTMNADGKFTLDEIVDAIGEGAEVGGSALVEIQKITAEMEAKKKAELVNLCKEKGLPTTGTKAELVARLAEAESVSTVEDDTDATTV